MSKLIDADAFVQAMKKHEWLGFSCTIVAAELAASPDASEPLRDELDQAKARIKELEGEVNCQEERIQSLERSLRIAKDEQRSCNQAFANLLQIPVYSWQRNWQTAARLVLALPADADVETINLALLLRDQGGQDA